MGEGRQSRIRLHQFNRLTTPPERHPDKFPVGYIGLFVGVKVGSAKLPSVT